MANHSLAEAIEALKCTRVRMTPQRHAILAFLYESRTHPTADEVYRALEERFPNMSVATVYNNLRVFKEVGIVKELTYGDASSRFDAMTSDHYHAICEECGKIVDFEYPLLDNADTMAEKITGFKVRTHRMEVYGTCPACQARQ